MKEYITLPANKVDSIELAKYIINTLIDRKVDVNYLKLQKLIYLINAWHLAYFDQPLIDDDFRAWVHGPASKKLWDYFHQKELSKQKGVDDFESQLTDDQQDLLDDLLVEYQEDSLMELNKLLEGEPAWKEARKGFRKEEVCETVMNPKTIKKYYRSLME